MTDRTPEQILAEWRECERRYEENPTSELARRIDDLRREHAAAVDERHTQAEELADLSPIRST